MTGKFSSYTAKSPVVGTDQILITDNDSTAVSKSVVLSAIKTFTSASPTLVTPALGTPSSGVISACTSTSMVMVTPVLGTPSSGTLTSCTGLPITGITSSTSAQLATLISDETGSGLLVFATSPTLTTPVLGTPTSGTLTNCTGLPAAGVVGTAAVLGANTFTADQTIGGFDLLGVSNIVHDISVTTVALDFSADELDTITVSATATFTCATYIAGASKTIKILDSGSGQTLAFPAGWIFVGTKPTAIAASKTAILTLTCFSTTEASVVAAYAVQT